MSEATVQLMRPEVSQPCEAPLLQLSGITKSFGGLDVLRGVDLTVADGSITGLLGPNGSGKTTCFNIASGFLKADQGSVLLRGCDINTRSVRERCIAGLVRTFQTPRVFTSMTVLENLMVGQYKAGRSGFIASALSTRAARDEMATLRLAAERCAERFGLASLLERKAGLLPAGQQRIVELARACIGEPQVLLLDEPSSGLNTEEIETLRQLITRLNADGLTVLLVSHDMGLMTVCHTASVLVFGEIIASGSFAEVQRHSLVREAYLGM